ncbi:MAG: mechanosensitive ion channel family protein [Flavisolibacter sp.]|nr:mechanosensitive ion channel family protein [Flavisolibacter sp.]
MRKFILMVLFILPGLLTKAQQKNGSDSLDNDTLHLTEQLLLQQQQQKKVDSLVTRKLQKEIQLLSNNSKRKSELEEQLHQIALRDSLRQIEQSKKIEQLRRTAEGHPVILMGDTLFLLYTRSGSFNAAERAAAISGRISKLYDNEFYDADSLQLIKSDNTYDIVYNNDMIVMSVSEIDALYFGKTPEQLGTEYLRVIRQTIHQKRDTNSLVNWLRRLGYVALVIAGIAMVIYIINRLFRIFSRTLIRKKDTYFRGISIHHFRLFTPQQHLTFILRALSTARIIAVLLALYLSLPVLFSIFPQTKAYAYKLLNWIISPIKSVLSSIVQYLPNLFTIVVIYLFTRYAVKGVRYVAHEVERGNLQIRGFYNEWAHPTYNIIRFLLYAFMLIVIFPYLPGSSSPAFQGISVFLGILFSLGSSSAIANVVAGLVITYMRPFKIGDRVKIGEITGDVLEKTLLVTRIRTIKNEEITVPNAAVLSSHTVNYTSGAEHNGLIVHTTITLGYDAPWKKVHQVLIQAALRTPLIEKEPPPFVLQTSLDDFYVSYQINAYTKNPSSMATIYSELHQNIQDCCNEAGIEILSPHYRSMRDGNPSTIPEDYLPQDDKAPAFDTTSNRKKDSIPKK